MQRLFVLLGGLFVSFGFSNNFFVSQTPSTVTLRKGDQVHLTCSWNISITGVKVRWFKDNRGFNQTSKLPETKNIKVCETLVLNNADRDVAGFYICEVTQDVPRLMKVNGTGTKVMYERGNEPETVATTLPPTTEHDNIPDSHSIPSKEPDRDRPDSHAIPSTERAAEDVYEDGPVIFAIRCVPFITLLLAVCFLSRGGPRTKNNHPRAGKPKEEEQHLVIEQENDKTGQEQLEEGEEKSGQRRKVRKRDKDSKHEGKVEMVNELSGTEREVEERNKQTQEEKKSENEERTNGTK